MMKRESKQQKVFNFIAAYPVPILFVFILIITVPLSGFSINYLVQEILSRLARDSFLVLALLLPIMAGMGLNFGIVLGAMAAQISLVFITTWHITGVYGIVLATLMAIPMATVLGYFCGVVLNKAKGREMITSLILGYFMDGIYQGIVLYLMGPVIPISNPLILLSRGYGIRNAISLTDIRQVLDTLIPIKLYTIIIPLFTYIVIAVFCVIVEWFKKTKLGQDMRAVGQDMAIADSAGIPVMKTRNISIIISTVLACIGQIIFLQNMGTINTYNSHQQTGMFAVAALLIGGATISRASIPNVFLGIVLFHLMFIVSPMAGKHLMGDAQIGEYFRVFVSYGVIAVALVLHEWKRRKERERSRQSLRGAGTSVRTT